MSRARFIVVRRLSNILDIVELPEVFNSFFIIILWEWDCYHILMNYHISINLFGNCFVRLKRRLLPLLFRFECLIILFLVPFVFLLLDFWLWGTWLWIRVRVFLFVFGRKLNWKSQIIKKWFHCFFSLFLSNVNWHFFIQLYLY